MPLFEPIYEPFLIEHCRRDAWSLFKPEHFHNCYEIYYLASGSITYFIRDAVYPIKHGDFIVIPPGNLHKTLPHQQPDHTRILLYIKPDFLDHTLECPGFLEKNFPEPVIITGREKLASELLDTLQKEAAIPDNAVMQRLLCGQLLLCLLRWQNQDQPLRTPLPHDGETPAHGKILEVARYLDDHYPGDCSLTTLAGRFYMSPSYLSRTFHQVMQISYRDYLIRLRIRHAAQLLMQTDKKITQIAQETGFRSDAHFGKMFRKILGCSPRQYRQSATIAPK